MVLSIPDKFSNAIRESQHLLARLGLGLVNFRNMTELKDRIREARERAGLTQVDLGAELGVTKGAVSQWETGRTEPDYRTLGRLCDLSRFSADYLVRGIVTEPSHEPSVVLSEEEQDLILAFRDIPRAHQRQLLDSVMAQAEEMREHYALMAARIKEAEQLKKINENNKTESFSDSKRYRPPVNSAGQPQLANEQWQVRKTTVPEGGLLPSSVKKAKKKSGGKL